MATRHICDRCGAETTRDYTVLRQEQTRYHSTLVTGPSKSKHDLCPSCTEFVSSAIASALQEGAGE